jgi:atypical dual specificity phosphatase
VQVPAAFQRNRAKRDGDQYHITVLSKDDVRASIKDRSYAAFFESIAPFAVDDWVDLGLGKAIDRNTNDKAYYKVLHWPGGAAVRHLLQLPAIDFHITVGFNVHDVHGVCKDQSTLLYNAADDTNATDSLDIDVTHLKKRVAACKEKQDFTSILHELSTCIDRASEAALSVSNHTLLLALCAYVHEKLGNTAECIAHADKAIALQPTNSIGYTRKATALMQRKQYQQAAQVLQHALDNAASVACERANLEKALARCNEKLAATSTSSTSTSQSLMRIAVPVALLPDDGGGSRPSSADATIDVELPHFSWIVHQQLAGMSEPNSKEQVAALSHINVGITINVSEHPLKTALLRGATFIPMFLQCENYDTPKTLSMTEQLVCRAAKAITEQAKSVVVHCPQGTGRTGMFMACYLVRFGAQPLQQPLQHTLASDHAIAMQPDQAIALIEQLRPGSIESDSQERYVHRYAAYVIKRHARLAAKRIAAEAAAKKYSARCCCFEPSQSLGVLIHLCVTG